MASDNSFAELKERISSALVETTKTSGLVANEDLAFQRSLNPAVAQQLDKQSARLLGLARGLAKVAVADTEVSPPQFEDVDSLEDNWRGVVDVVDNLLEKSDACLDEYTGVVKRPSPSEPENASGAPISSKKQRPDKLYRTQNIPKPQLLFAKAPSNKQTTPFKPLLQTKPHAIIPLEESLKLEAGDDGIKQYHHPYEKEITESKYPSFIYERSQPIAYPPFETTTAAFVDTFEGVVAMLEYLKSASEIAVDLEHHDAHSYIGVVSLMQISTRDHDWIIDTLKPWREDLQILNEVFANPSVLKVLHGSSSDMVWLQRDLGLYVVGLFDTYHASHALGYPKHGLAFLLSRFAHFEASKQYQTADWRIRPLPQEMFNYARSDTHFLLYIYDSMRNELLDRSDPSRPQGDLVDSVLQHSKREALQRYENPLYDIEGGSGPVGWYNILKFNPALFNKQQFAVFRAVHRWRDDIARQEDEATYSIMSKQVLLKISTNIPTNKPALFGSSGPITSYMKQNLDSLLKTINEARLAGEAGPDSREMMQKLAPLHVKHYAGNSTAEVGVLANSGAAVPGQTTRSGLPAKSDRSQLWGSTTDFGSVVLCKAPLITQPESLRLVLPLPQLTAEVFGSADTQMVPETEKTEPGARAEHQFVKNREVKKDEVFVVKQVGGPRKRKAMDMYDSTPDGDGRGPFTNDQAEAEEVDISFAVDDPERIAKDKAERRAQRKAQKRLQKDQQKQDEGQHAKGNATNIGEDTIQPFDYASAPSVLHAKRENGNQRRLEPINPYAKSMDAPKGMPKAKKGSAGKSFTYKS